MHTYISRIILLLLCLLLGAPALTALDLPVKRVNGRQYYYYKVGKHETIYGISKQLGISREDIVRCNPDARDGVRNKQVLYFPVDEFETVDSEVSQAEVPDTAQAEKPLIAKRPLITVPLNIDSSAAELPRARKLTLDFYRGVLLGADTLASRRGYVEINAVSYASPSQYADSASLAGLLAEAAVVVAPNDDVLFSRLAEAAPDYETYVLNVFNVRDSSQLVNRYVVQANVPQHIMYRKAADYFLHHLGDARPVILRNTSGRNEKEPFTAYLEQRLAEQGIGITKVEYDGNLTRADLTGAELTDSTEVVFVPSSGTLAEFNRFAAVLKNFRDARLATAVADDGTGEPAVCAVFGYPDWVAFRGDAEDMLHDLGAVVYSRFYDDWTSFRSRNIDTQFRRWFGDSMVESVPTQGLLGFDVSTYLIKNIRANTDTYNPAYPSYFDGIQSAFRFEQVPGGGYVNTALFIIRFMAGSQISAQVL